MHCVTVTFTVFYRMEFFSKDYVSHVFSSLYGTLNFETLSQARFLKPGKKVRCADDSLARCLFRLL